MNASSDTSVPRSLVLLYAAAAFLTFTVAWLVLPPTLGPMVTLGLFAAAPFIAIRTASSPKAAAFGVAIGTVAAIVFLIGTLLLIVSEPIIRQ